MEKSILILSSHYYPETCAGAKRATAFAEFLASKGWRVTVITLLPNYPFNAIYEGYNFKTPYESYEKDVKVIRLKPLLVPRDNFFLRILAEFVFAIKVFFSGYTQKANFLLVTTPFMLLAPSAFVLAKLKRMAFVWDVRDITWLYLRFMGRRTYGLAVFFDWIMKKVGLNADLLISPVQGIVQYFEKVNPKSLLVPNGVSKDFLEKTRSLVNEYKIVDRPIILYAGLFGYMQGLSTLIEAAAKLPEYDFLLIGDGPEKEFLVKKAKGVKNVTFSPYVTKEELLEFYKRSTVCVSLLTSGGISKIAEPSKVWEYMATGRPVVYCGESSMAKLFVERDLAVVCEPGQLDAFVFAIRELINSPERAKEIGRKGREFVERERVRETILENFEKELLEILSKRARNGRLKLG